MTKLQGGRFVYQENLGGLCSTCNDNGYLVFGDINMLIAANIFDELIRVCRINKSACFFQRIFVTNYFYIIIEAIIRKIATFTTVYSSPILQITYNYNRRHSFT
jgi:hypothetical protein